jgi:hypothetical protein
MIKEGGYGYIDAQPLTSVTRFGILATCWSSYSPRMRQRKLSLVQRMSSGKNLVDQ